MSYGFPGFQPASPSRREESRDYQPSREFSVPRASSLVRVEATSTPTVPTIILEPGTEQNLYFSVGGGLSPSRIVKKIEATEELLGRNLMHLVEYVGEHQDSDEERMIAQTVQNRQTKTDYLVIVNGGIARPNSYLSSANIRDAAVQKTRGEVSFPYIDIAIVSAEEGGTKDGKSEKGRLEKRLEERLEERKGGKD